MKGIILTLATVLAFTTCEQKRDPVPVDYRRIREIEAQHTVLQERVSEQDSRLTRWRIAAIILAVGWPLLLLVGAALGSKAKRDET